MALTLGIIGLSKSGKTAVFNALTRSEAQTSAYANSGSEPNMAMVKVPDERLDTLAAIFSPKRVVQADVQYTDVAGLSKGAGKNESFSRQFLNYISKVDTLVHVVRAFSNADVPHPEETINPLRDVETLELEITFSDMAVMEKRITKLREGIAKIKGPEREVNERELAVLERLLPELEAGKPIRDLDLSEDEERAIRNFQFLTAKPMLVLLNIDESQLAESERLIAEVRAKLPFKNTEVAAIAGQIEMELTQLSEEDAAVFLSEYGLKQSGLNRVIGLSYKLLGLISFLTAGADECRAWTIRNNTNAQKAAGTIHSDLERGFIRAQVVSFDDLVAAGSLAEARKRGTLRSEGKTYLVKDGDVIEVLFNV